MLKVCVQETLERVRLALPHASGMRWALRPWKWIRMMQVVQMVNVAGETKRVEVLGVLDISEALMMPKHLTHETKRPTE